ncbi:alpha/beta fold hydrolase [Ferrimonas balearica]|uniref:alpha/beta hydrolase family protein n=1 Tax=Ferrimonas balearica TaxID=44012 RepID=UPI001C9925B0|nr:alpha/beta fold hydrolase [Ferrimonas balearica]MBY5991928.1 alpha/beta fold hydrolase [Ferrimonas balearica]
MHTQPLRLRCADGQGLGATFFHPPGEVLGGVLIAPALGVSREYYRHLAGHLAESGYRVLTLDYRGVGESRLTAQRPQQVGLLDWARQDLSAALAALQARLEGLPLFWLGHSCGGQLLGLVPGAEQLDGAITVGSSVPHWRYYGRRGPAMWGFWHLAAPLLSLGQRFPAQRTGLARRDLPSGLIRQWARWGRQRDYLFAPKLGLDLSGYQRFDKPMLNYGFADDGYAPPEAVLDLADRFPRAFSETHILSGERLEALGGVGHFGYFDPRHQAGLWQDLTDWLTRYREAASAPGDGVRASR